MTAHREGPPLIYVPVCKHPADYLYCTGPIGYERVEAVGECPLTVEAPDDTGANDA